MAFILTLSTFNVISRYLRSNLSSFAASFFGPVFATPGTNTQSTLKLPVHSFKIQLSLDYEMYLEVRGSEQRISWWVDSFILDQKDLVLWNPVSTKHFSRKNINILSKSSRVQLRKRLKNIPKDKGWIENNVRIILYNAIFAQISTFSFHTRRGASLTWTCHLNFRYYFDIQIIFLHSYVSFAISLYFGIFFFCKGSSASLIMILQLHLTNK